MTSRDDAPESLALAQELLKASKALTSHCEFIQRMAKGDAEDRSGHWEALEGIVAQVSAIADSKVRAAAQFEAAERHAEAQLLELESDLRESIGSRGWRIDGQWPTLVVEYAIAVGVDSSARTVTVGREKMSALNLRRVVEALEAQVKVLLPKGFQPSDFLATIGKAYDKLAAANSTASIFEIYRECVVSAQPSRFWQDARPDVFVGLGQDQFKARLTACLVKQVDRLGDGRRLRLLPPISPSPKESMFLYQPAEGRFGHVGRLSFQSSGGDT